MRRRFNRKSGLTLIEVTVASAFLMLVLGSLSAVTLKTQQSFHDGLESARLEGRAHRTMERMIRELLSAKKSGIQPVLDQPGEWTPALTFQANKGFGASQIVWGPNVRIQFEYDPAEANNGKDDDGDGLVDEGQVVLVVSPGTQQEKRVTLVRGVREYLEGEVGDGKKDENGNGLVDERGLAFTRDGDELLIQLSLERVDGNGEHRIATAEARVYLKN